MPRALLNMPDPQYPLRILHIEDSPADAELTASVLRAEWRNCRIRLAQNRTEIEAALAEGPHELVLSDFALPQFDGLSALKLVRQHDPHVPFIFLSGTIGEENAVHAVLHGATDYVIKDRPGRLVSAVRRALETVELTRRRREAEERFQQLAQQSLDAFWFIDLNPERLAYVSPAFHRLWGISEEQLAADPRAWIKAIHPEDRARVEQAFDECVRGLRSRFNEEYRLTAPDGSERWILDTGTVIRNDAGKVVRVCGIAKDITEKQILTRQFLRAQRLESIGTLAGGIAHDLNNVLAPILMAVEIVRRRTDDPNIQRLMNTIETSGRHGAELIKQVLSFARGTQGARAAVKVPAVVREMVALLRETLPRSIALETSFAEDLPTVDADATQLNQVLMNLCVNARDAMPRGGRLSLRVGVVAVNEAQAGRFGVEPGRYVQIIVEDTGTGIPPEIRDRIFDPFFTTKGEGRGTGLGLATVAEIVRDHRGFVDIDSEIARGTMFRVHLPASSAEEEVAPAPRQDAHEPASGTVLVIDDELGLREVARAFLESQGYRVLVAADGVTGLTLYRQHRAEIRAVLTDMMMPLMQGDQVIRELRAIDPNLPIVAMSGALGERLLRQEEPGRLVFLQKPMTGPDLLGALERLFGASGG